MPASRSSVPTSRATSRASAFPGSASHKLHDKLVARANLIGLEDYGYGAAPTIFWDVFGENGHPIRATISEMGPLLLSRLMGLTDAQEGVLNIAFEYADDNGLLLLDLKDLRKLLVHLSQKEVRDEISQEYGNVAAASLGAVQRNLLVLEREGADHFFGEPALQLEDLMRTTQGRTRLYQRARRHPADQQPETLFHLPALAPLGTVRAPAGSRRPGQTKARFLLRRGPPPVQ